MSGAPARGVVVLLGISLLALPWPAAAVLGEAVSSVQADQMRLQGARRISTALRYQVHDIRSTNGSVVKQFAGPAGQVFCVSWRSKFKPDLAELLGSSYRDYAVAMAKSAPAKGFARRNDLASGQLEVSEVAHMGWFTGQACLRNLVPEGVSAHALR